MKLTKKLVVLGLSAIMAMSVVGCSNNSESTVASADQKDTTVVATVNGVEITSERLDSEMAYAESMAMGIFGEEYKENEDAMAFLETQKQAIINFLIEDEIITQKLKEFNIEVSDETVEEEFLAVKGEFESEEVFQEALKSSNITEDDLKTNIRDSFEVQGMIDELIKDVVINDEDVKAYYDKNIGEYTTGAGAEMFHILVATEEEAKKVKEEYEAGATFEELAGEYGTDGTATKGGALGFIEYESQDYDADFLAGAKGLEEGEVSEPIKTQFGYHLIKVENIDLEEVVTPFEEVEGDIKLLLKQTEESAIIEETMLEWIEAAEITIAE